MKTETKEQTYKGKTFRFHNPNGQPFTLLWSDGWELADDAAKALGWKRINHGPATWGHVSYRL